MLTSIFAQASARGARTAQELARLLPTRHGWILACVALGCGEPFLPKAVAEQMTLEGPIAGLSGAQESAHNRGDAEFARNFSPATGLGPLFVAASCSACHVADGRGHPALMITRFGRYAGSAFDPMESHGGPQLQNRSVAGYEAERVPGAATAIGRFMAPAVSGLGLLEAIDDSTLLRLADPDDTNGDGISGRASFVDSTAFTAGIVALSGRAGAGSRHLVHRGRYLARFGRKAGAITLLHQTVSAYSEDMGITTDLIPRELLNVQTGAAATDLATDPEASSAVVDAVVFYLRTLRAPPRRGADNANVKAGEQLFTDIGCALCHTPRLRTGASDVAPLHRVEIHPYSDLLLHDMGADLDDRYTEADAASREWRTTPLWGLGLASRTQGGTPFYLHDGRARTLRDAIRFHGGEGSRSRSAFDALPRERQELLLAFLESL